MSGEKPAGILPIGAYGQLVEDQLAYRARHPDLWAAQWPDSPRLMAAHERFSRILLHYCRWPNAFFIPDDDSNIMIDAGEFESLDLITVIMTIEEVFDIRIDDDHAQKFPISYMDGKYTYGQLLEAIIALREPGVELTGAGCKWEPLSLPPDYFEKSLWHDIKRHLPFTWTDASLHRELRRLQVIRHPAWPRQWEDFDDRLLQLRDRVSRILIDELDWFDDAFIPQDRLEAMFHSRRGLEFAAGVLAKINDEFKSDIEFDFITSRKHTYEDFLQKLAETS